MQFKEENSVLTVTLIPTLIIETDDVNKEFHLQDSDIDTQSVATQIEQLKRKEDGKEDSKFVSLITSLICSVEQNQDNE